MKVLAVALSLSASCVRPLTPAEQEIGDVAFAAEMQRCVSMLRVSHPAGARPGTFPEWDRDGSVVRSHRSEYDIEACGVAVHLTTVCAERRGGKMACDLTFRGAATVGQYEPPHRSRLVAEMIAVFEHAQPRLRCPLFAGPFELNRAADGAHADYTLEACGARRAFG